MKYKIIKLLVVEDHPLFRQGVVEALSLESDFIVEGQAGYGADALALLRARKYDVALLDMNLPDMKGIEIVGTAKKEGIKTKFLALTGENGLDLFLEGVSIGMEGCCTKEVDPEVLSRVIRMIADKLYVYPDSSDINAPVLSFETYEDLTEYTIAYVTKEYTPLNLYLLGIPMGQNIATIKFYDLRKIFKGTMPSFSYLDVNWWKDTPQGVYVHSHAWLDAGWRIDEVNIEDEWVRFIRANVKTHRLRNKADER